MSTDPNPAPDPTPEPPAPDPSPALPSPSPDSLAAKAMGEVGEKLGDVLEAVQGLPDSIGNLIASQGPTPEPPPGDPADPAPDPTPDPAPQEEYKEVPMHAGNRFARWWHGA